MPTVTMRQLLEAGVHFGHQTRRWNPKMRPFIFAERNGIHIIDLAQTVQRMDLAVDFVRETVARGDSVLFVGTKKQAQEPVAEEATRAGMPYINQRWLGGFLTNFVTIKKRLGLLEQLEAREAAGEFEWMTKKEASRVRDELNRLRRTLGGVRKMRRLPGAIFVIDPQREKIAVTEARKLEMPVIGTGDTNIDPDQLDYVIPANDDAIRAIRLLCRVIADGCLEGAEERATRAEAAPELEAEAEGAEAASDEYIAALAAGEGLIFEPGTDEEEEEDYLALAPALPAPPAPRVRARPAVIEEESEAELIPGEAEPAAAPARARARKPARAAGPAPAEGSEAVGTGEVASVPESAETPPAVAEPEPTGAPETAEALAPVATAKEPAKAAEAAKPSTAARSRRTTTKTGASELAEPVVKVQVAEPAAPTEASAQEPTEEPAPEPAEAAAERPTAKSGASRS